MIYYLSLITFAMTLAMIILVVIATVFVCKAELETPGAASEQAGSSDQED